MDTVTLREYLKIYIIILSIVLISVNIVTQCQCHNMSFNLRFKVMVFNVTFNNISVIVAVSFIGGGNQSTRRKPQIVIK